MEYYSNFIKPFIPVASLLISLFTVILAYRIYRNFDIKKTFLKEQLLAVCELSNEFYKFGLPTHCISGGTASSHLRFFDFFNQGIERYEKIYFTTHRPEEILPFIKHMHNILLPKTIADVVKRFDLNILPQVNPEDMPRKYILIQTLNETKVEANYLYYNYYMEYTKFNDLAKELITEIAIWLKEYGAKEINFPEHMLKKK